MSDEGGKVRNRSAEIDREWRRIERNELLTELFVPVTCLSIVGIFFGVLLWYYPTVAGVVMGTISAIGMPFAMWYGRRRD